ncbi:hypothetical protein PTI98_010240 [Pleurotus ostreatus]|nr:hypothetical protein PTI98_010240 [Pleurotus ostreatus]
MSPSNPGSAMAQGSGSQITLSILRAYFPVVRTLSEHLKAILQPSEVAFETVHDNDSPAFTSFLQTFVVCLHSETPRHFCVLPPMMRIHELIDRAQERILNSARPQNIITSGYKLRSSDSQRGKTNRIGVVNFFVNTMVTALQTPEWQLLLERLASRP